MRRWSSTALMGLKRGVCTSWVKTRGVPRGGKVQGVYGAAGREAGAGDVCRHPAGVLQGRDPSVHGRDGASGGVAPVRLRLRPGVAGQLGYGAAQNVGPAQWGTWQDAPQLPSCWRCSEQS